MQNKLGMLLLLLLCFSVQVSHAQKIPAGLTPEQETQWRETIEINKMLTMRQNPQPVTKLRGITAEEVVKNAQTAQKSSPSPISEMEKEARVRQRIQAYFKAHPEQGPQYNWGNLPPARGAIMVMEIQGTTAMEQVSFDKLSDVQKVALFETEPTLKQAWDDNLQVINTMDTQTQNEYRRKIWVSYVNNLKNNNR